MKNVAINAHLLSQGAGYRRAGIHQYIYNILSHLPNVDESFSYTVLLNHHLEMNLPRVEERIGMLNTNKPLKRILWEQLIQPFALRRVKPSLYHAMAFVIPVAMPCPSVVTVYDLSFMRFPEVLTTFRRNYLQRFTRSSCERATRIIAISESTAQDIVEFWGIPREKIDVTLLGVSPEFHPLPEDKIEAFRIKKGLPKRFLFFVGTLEPRKNLPMLIRAYGNLPQDMRDEVHLVLGGGKGWLYDEIFETIERLHLGDRVHTPGYIPAEDLALWYNAADALVYPTVYEGFGFPVIEAMACGKPVLASDSSSLPEVVGNVGILLPPDDESAWTQALSKIILSDQWRADQKSSLEAWAGQFTWQRTARQTIESYQKAL
jgi:glycosyltransferase involved in cell wall biosynthesis